MLTLRNIKDKKKLRIENMTNGFILNFKKSLIVILKNFHTKITKFCTKDS